MARDDQILDYELPPIDAEAEANPQPYAGGRDSQVHAEAGDTKDAVVVGGEIPDLGPVGMIYRQGTHAPYDAYQALGRAAQEHYHPTRSWYYDCQYFARTRYGLPGIYGSASIAYYNTNDRHTSWPPPPGAFVWWTVGPGHVALSIGDGTCWTSDFLRPGKIDRVRITSITKGWRKPYRGWSTDNNEVKCIDPPDMIDASQVIHAAKTGGRAHNGNKLKRAVGEEVGKGNMDYSNNVLGTGFRHQYALLQKKWFGGKGDGIPGPTGLLRLCDRHGLTLVP